MLFPNLSFFFLVFFDGTVRPTGMGGHNGRGGRRYVRGPARHIKVGQQARPGERGGLGEDNGAACEAGGESLILSRTMARPRHGGVREAAWEVGELRVRGIWK